MLDMARQAPTIVLDTEERKALETIVRSPTSAQRDVMRARIVLLAAKGQRNDQIQEALGVSKPVVIKMAPPILRFPSERTERRQRPGSKANL